jgi:hypothetical protein
LSSILLGRVPHRCRNSIWLRLDFISVEITQELRSPYIQSHFFGEVICVLHNFLLRRTKLHCCQSVGYGGHSSTRLMIKKRFLIFYLHYFYYIGEKLLLIQGKQKFFATLPANRFSPKKANMAATTYIFSMNQKTAFLGCAVEFSLYSLLFVFGAIKYLHVLLYRVNISRPTVCCCCLDSEPFPDIPRCTLMWLQWFF